MKFVQVSSYILCLLFLLISTGCKQEERWHIIISENLEELSESGLKQEILLRPNQYKTSWACLFDGRMTFEALDMEVSLLNQQGRTIERDTLSFQLAKEKGEWCDKNVLVHEAKAHKDLHYQNPYTGIYTFRIKLLHHHNLDGILALSLELSPEASEKLN